MIIVARLAVAAVSVVAVGLLAIGLVLRGADTSRVGGPSPSPSLSASPAPSLDFPAMATTFVSPTNGLSFKYLDRGGLEPATRLWDPVNDPRSQAGFDAVESGLGAYFLAASTRIPPGVALDSWVDVYVTPGPWLQTPGPCGGPRSGQEAITIDGHSGRVAECGNRIDATVVAGERLYLFTLLDSRTDGRALFDAWIATVDLRPDEAPVSSTAPAE